MLKDENPRGSGGPRRAEGADVNAGRRPLTHKVKPPTFVPAPHNVPTFGSAPATAADPRAEARAQVAQGVRHYNTGRYAAALQHFLAAVRLDPLESEYHNMLGCTADRAGQPQLVEQHLLEAIRLAPTHAGAHTALGAWYAERGPIEKALHHSAAAVAAAPNDPKAILTRASALFAASDKEATLQTLKPLLDQPVPNRWVAQLYSRVAPGVGHEEQALAVLDRALAAPDLGTTADGKALLLFAASGLLERLHRFDESFDRARAANEIVRTSRPPFDPAAHSARVSNLIRYFTRRRMDALPRATHGNRRPIFIVGMPRSGTSLVEQVLATHPEVYGAGELDTLGVIARDIAHTEWARGEAMPQSLNMISPRRANELAGRYLSTIDAMNSAARYVTDKMPSNFLHLALAELLFPDCRVIHCIRNSLDTCVSCYMSNFANGNEFSFDLSHLGPYYRDYHRLMEHWKGVLSVPILDVRYEDLVLDTEGQVRRLLEFLELPWDERCLSFYENRRSVQTSSKDQVKRPIYTSSVARWKLYEKHVGALIASLSTPAESQRRAG